ncbi:MAG: NUDIX hydrolase [Candidatus Margulisiibacteriota bacterium]|nr:MAG: hypothetical protein A2X43_02935 [Candidatus Margulisbacteria bacterium GWD2_39_127]OGI01211.1 MAG: hypothetical protein A2X42_06250 [Candidatus Margulisbacteria bacterium GWF2_38_17]OGI09846.1 MAG: hypothetical protein A2X41_09970 [Candidatus Margulisbacteria bacterium GWE2_39_32]PZM78436.1 MAG: NUDIX hydrolase [Candidatus Margulisiibacteriota bacterium]HAR64152.1 NUDIX hydrolase [Candidatus Margulisiibacteriota bacterium]
MKTKIISTQDTYISIHADAVYNPISYNDLTKIGGKPILGKIRNQFLAKLNTASEHRAMSPYYLEHDGGVKSYYVDQNVLTKGVERGWADPEDPRHVNYSNRKTYTGNGTLAFKDGVPQNPYLSANQAPEGRGLLGKWGVNAAADFLITFTDNEGKLRILMIRRADTRQFALPGGMVDPGEKFSQTALRELEEETGIPTGQLREELDNSGEAIYQGYVDDPRNTRNAWMETNVFHLNLTKELASSIQLQAGDDAMSVEWAVATPELISSLYASHGDYVLMSVARLIDEGILSAQPYKALFEAKGYTVQ